MEVLSACVCVVLQLVVKRAVGVDDSKGYTSSTARTSSASLVLGVYEQYCRTAVLCRTSALKSPLRVGLALSGTGLTRVHVHGWHASPIIVCNELSRSSTLRGFVRRSTARVNKVDEPSKHAAPPHGRSSDNIARALSSEPLAATEKLHSVILTFHAIPEWQHLVCQRNSGTIVHVDEECWPRT